MGSTQSTWGVSGGGSAGQQMMKSLSLLALVAGAVAQKPARIGADGKPLLNRPDIEECMKRKTHMKVGNHNYFLSWREPWHKFEDWDWFNGRNFCRDRCMDLVSFNTPGEFKMFEEIMRRDNVTSIYTSGRKCNFQNKGCDGAHLQPINVNGWFWAGANNDRIPPTNPTQRLSGVPLEKQENPSLTMTRVSRRAPYRPTTTLGSPSRGCRSSTMRPAWPCTTTSTGMALSGTTWPVILGL